MTLRKQSLIVVGVTLVCLVAVLYGSSRAILYRSFGDLEAGSVRQDVQRARNAVLDELDGLDTMLFDWSAWDDTHAFVQDPGEGYVASNLVDATFASNRLNLIALVDGAGQLVWGRVYDPERNEQQSVAPDLRAYITGDALLLRHPDVESRCAGILLLDRAPLLVAARPILTSVEQGPIRGTMVMGRYLDETEVQRLSQVTSLSLTVRRFDDPELPADMETARFSFSTEQPTVVQPLSADIVAGYALLADLYGRPALLLRVDTPRDIYAQGQISTLYLFLSLLLVALIFGAVTLALMDRAILSRVERLATGVTQVGESNDLTIRLLVPGKDELASLANRINGMLDALERSQREIRESEERLRTIVQNMPAMMVAFDQDGRITVWNHECERVTGYNADEIVGNPQAMDLLWPDPEYRRRMTVEWFSRGYDYRDWEWRITCKEGSVKTIAWANISRRCPIPGWESWSIGADVTARVQAQIGLRQRLAEQETLFFIGRMISSTLEAGEAMQLVSEHMAHLIGAVCCAISDWTPGEGALTVRARYAPPEHREPGDPHIGVGQVVALSDRPAAAAALRDRTPFVAYQDDPESDPHERQRLQRLRWSAVAGIPIVAGEQVIGLAEAYLARGRPPFTDHDMRLLQSLVDQVAIAINNARLFSVVQANEVALRDLSLRLIDAQEQERRRVAQELHDELGQLLTAIKINVDLARRRLPDGETVLQRRLDEASDLTDKVLTNVRTITVELRPTLLDDMGIVPTLRWHVKRFAQRTGVEVRLDASELPCRLSSEIETTLYRVAQEALTNVARHARSARARVHLDVQEDVVTLSVEDEGHGFDVDEWARRQKEHPSLGLTGIQERVMLLNGRVTIDSQPGNGTRIVTELPARYRT